MNRYQLKKLKYDCKKNIREYHLANKVIFDKAFTDLLLYGKAGLFGVNIFAQEIDPTIKNKLRPYIYHEKSKNLLNEIKKLEASE